MIDIVKLNETYNGHFERQAEDWAAVINVIRLVYRNGILTDRLTQYLTYRGCHLLSSVYDMDAVRLKYYFDTFIRRIELLTRLIDAKIVCDSTNNIPLYGQNVDIYIKLHFNYIIHLTITKKTRSELDYMYSQFIEA